MPIGISGSSGAGSFVASFYLTYSCLCPAKTAITALDRGSFGLRSVIPRIIHQGCMTAGYKHSTLCKLPKLPALVALVLWKPQSYKVSTPAHCGTSCTFPAHPGLGGSSVPFLSCSWIDSCTGKLAHCRSYSERPLKWQLPPIFGA